MYNPKQLLGEINNKGFRVKINFREVNNTYVLFTNLRENVDGKTQSKTRRIAVLYGTDELEDKRNLYNAFKERLSIENQYNKNSRRTEYAGKVFIVDYIREISYTYTNGDTGSRLRTLIKHVENFDRYVQFLSDIDKSYCMKLREYFEKKYPRSGYKYFKLFKSVLYKAIEEELIPDMPYLRKLQIKIPKSQREYLTQDELRKLKEADIPDNLKEYRDAFMFACFTGLRYVDLRRVHFSNILEGRLIITQQKTSEPINIKLSKVAIDIVNKQRKKYNNEGAIFKIMCQRHWVSKMSALFNVLDFPKKITGHCARHTFATMCISNGVDIYTTSKLLGHTNVVTTQIYAKLVDSKKDEAIDMLPVV